MKRADRHAWYEGPVFTYQASSTIIEVNVTGSSWAIRNKRPASKVVTVIREHAKRAGVKILDFGAGAWLNYTRLMKKRWPEVDLTVVEYPEAFREKAGPIRDALAKDVTFWSPRDLLKEKEARFDLILLVNVLNVIPEEEHRDRIFRLLAKRLLPTGKLLVYQRKWVESECRGAPPYGDGWMIRQKRYRYYTYLAGTGAGWFNERAQAANLIVTAAPKLKSDNTLLKMWVRGLR